jgi:hypothetical protein
MQNESENLDLTETEDDVRQLEQHIADQQIRIKVLQAAGHIDDEMKRAKGYSYSPTLSKLPGDAYRLNGRYAVLGKLL